MIFLSPLLSPHFRKKEKEKTGLNYRIRLNEYIKRRSILHFVITMLIWTPDARGVLWCSKLSPEARWGGGRYVCVITVSFTILLAMLFFSFLIKGSFRYHSLLKMSYTGNESCKHMIEDLPSSPAPPPFLRSSSFPPLPCAPPPSSRTLSEAP